MSDIDPVQFGHMMATVQTTAKSVEQLVVQVKNIEDKFNKGRGFITGLSFGMAALGGTAGAYVHKLLENIK